MLRHAWKVVLFSGTFFIGTKTAEFGQQMVKLMNLKYCRVEKM
jgi:hypothetical protein